MNPKQSVVEKRRLYRNRRGFRLIQIWQPKDRLRRLRPFFFGFCFRMLKLD